MGYIRCHTIVVNGVLGTHIQKAHKKAKSLFKHLVSNIVDSKMNCGASFFIAPDDSKEGWGTSDKMDKARKAFVDWIEGKGYSFVEVKFGDDYSRIPTIINGN